MVWLTPHQLNPDSKFFCMKSFLQNEHDTYGIGCMFIYYTMSKNGFKDDVLNKSDEQCELDRALLEAVGFPDGVDGIQPNPDIEIIRRLLESGATLDHFVPFTNADNQHTTWLELANAFILSMKHIQKNDLLDVIIDNCRTWQSNMTLEPLRVALYQPFKSFSRILTATPLGLSFEFGLTRCWQKALGNKTCLNPILEFLRFSRSSDKDGHVINTKETKLEQLRTIAVHYNFTTTMKEDLRLLAESTTKKSFGDFSTFSRQSVRDNLLLVIEYISIGNSSNFAQSAIGRSYNLDGPLFWRYDTPTENNSSQMHWVVNTLQDAGIYGNVKINLENGLIKVSQKFS